MIGGDVITSAVIRESLASIVREMRRAMVRSSYSSIIYEGYDFSCVIIDGQGRLVAQSGEDHPFHIIPVIWSVTGLLAKNPQIGEDDLFLHNDPYTGGTHLNDVAVLYPVMDGARILFFIVIRSHWADIGGMTPGSLSGGARDIHQEGLRLDHFRTDKSGRSDALAFIFDNVRISDEAMADFQAVIGTCRVAERRLRAVLARHGTQTVAAAVEELLDTAERRMRAAIGRHPDGVYRGVAYLDGNSATEFPLRVACTLTVDGETVSADFAGTSPQVPAPLNAGPAIGVTSVMTIVKSFLDPAGDINSGTLRPCRVLTPAGSIIHATYPAPCGGLNEVRFAADAAVMAALARSMPDRMTGDVRGTSNHTYIGGHDARRNRPFVFYEYPSGGTGGFNGRDGNHAVRAFNEGENVSIQSAEVVEAIYPLRILRNELRADSGGAGRFRGGCGLVRDVEVLCDSGRLSVLSDRNLIPPSGVNGARAGAPNRMEVVRGGETLQPSTFPGKVTDFPLLRGDIVRMMSSGGGGFGPAEDRSSDLLAEDVADGVVTLDGLAHYGAGLNEGRTNPRVPPPDECMATILFLGHGLAVERCRVSRALAAGLALRPNQLVEVLVAAGPALRFWIDDIVDHDDKALWLDPEWRQQFDSVSCRVRAMPTGTPAYVTALRQRSASLAQ